MTDRIERPLHLLMVKLNKGRTREVDVRLAHSVRRDESARKVWIDWRGGADPLEIHYSEFDRVWRAWRIAQEHRAADGQETTENGRDLAAIHAERPFIEMDGYPSVITWTPEKGGERSPGNEAVALQIPMKIADVSLTALKLFRSKGILDALIDALVKHREDVWPTR